MYFQKTKHILKKRYIKKNKMNSILLGLNLEGINVVVIGYPSCPYSLKSLDLISQLDRYREHFKFISFGSHNTQTYFQTVTNFKAKFNYHGTFPLLFIRSLNGFQYIGGFSEFEGLNT
jgi:hypothetical protein